MLSSPPRPHPPFIPNIRLAENVNENTYFFYSCLSVSVVSSSASACVRVALSSFVTQFRACLFLYAPHNLPSHFYRSFLCSCICLYAPFPPRIIMFCVLFSVSELFVPFSVSFLSLLGPCVEGGQCRLSALCG